MIIGIPVYNEVDLLDVTGPYEIFQWMNQSGKPVDVLLIGETAADVTSRDGFTFKVHKTFDQVTAIDVNDFPRSRSSRGTRAFTSIATASPAAASRRASTRRSRWSSSSAATR